MNRKSRNKKRAQKPANAPVKMLGNCVKYSEATAVENPGMITREYQWHIDVWESAIEKLMNIVICVPDEELEKLCTNPEPVEVGSTLLKLDCTRLYREKSGIRPYFVPFDRKDFSVQLAEYISELEKIKAEYLEFVRLWGN